MQNKSPSKIEVKSLPTQEAQEFIDRIKQSFTSANFGQMNKVEPKAKPVKAKPVKAKPVKAKPVKARKKGVMEPKPLSGKNADDVPPKLPPRPFVLAKIVADEDSKDAEGNVFSWTPAYETDGAANADLRANITPDVHGNRVITLTHRTGALVDCGFSLQLPPNYKAEVSARSSWAKRGLIVTNAPGQIDEDYRGRIGVLVVNVGKETVVIRHGDRLAQIWPSPTVRFEWDKVTELNATERGVGGFGSTGDN